MPDLSYSQPPRARLTLLTQGYDVTTQAYEPLGLADRTMTSFWPTTMSPIVHDDQTKLTTSGVTHKFGWTRSKRSGKGIPESAAKTY
jgi:hypothetical protein